MRVKNHKSLSDTEKQFTILANEAPPNDAFIKAFIAVQDALSQMKSVQHSQGKKHTSRNKIKGY